MKQAAGITRSVSSLWLVLLLLIATAGRAQPGAKPAVPSIPTASATGTDTTRLVPQVTQNGVRFLFRERGTGPLAQPGRRVAVRYTGFLPDGHIFDASEAAGRALRFRVGRGEVIPGWDELLPLLPEGSRVRAWIPAALAYGAAGVRDPDDDSRFVIPPDTELLFELQILSVR
ncbi:FKBP-type peptidyl-prolyl cis-trans isomerase [Hymenobacter sp. IS2118]|uniref:FKBP-type peptidyl-prolyl cis-trans isomerase n=1 Tax=Hymenobacter sp. IS2118 TaxID=1505605 RepID=UPI00068D0F84|nr:FKBP-type peptidyl-prolyl cis-trans isomerase [Hymenobacter sp. IS2118]